MADCPGDAYSRLFCPILCRHRNSLLQLKVPALCRCGLPSPDGPLPARRLLCCRRCRQCGNQRTHWRREGVVAPSGESAYRRANALAPPLRAQPPAWRGKADDARPAFSGGKVAADTVLPIGAAGIPPPAFPKSANVLLAGDPPSRQDIRKNICQTRLPTFSDRLKGIATHACPARVRYRCFPASQWSERQRRPQGP